jgi:hypothetical protein
MTPRRHVRMAASATPSADPIRGHFVFPLGRADRLPINLLRRRNSRFLTHRPARAIRLDFGAPLARDPETGGLCDARMAPVPDRVRPGGGGNRGDPAALLNQDGCPPRRHSLSHRRVHSARISDVARRTAATSSASTGCRRPLYNKAQTSGYSATGICSSFTPVARRRRHSL